VVSVAATPGTHAGPIGASPDPRPRAYEVKWDGFRAIVRAGDDYRVRSRRGWDMTARAVRTVETSPSGQAIGCA
jgi:ATP-dependent DNA ligase